jgi:hypothetical protein
VSHQHDLLVCIALLSLAVGALLPAVCMGQQRGWLAGVAAFALFCLAFVGCLFIVFGLLLVGEFIKRGGPRYPPCHSGKCKGRRWPSLHDKDMGDYERVWVGDDSVLRCKCGKDYVTRDAERRFMERLPDGTLKPYMVHRDYRGWVPDTDAKGGSEGRPG